MRATQLIRELFDPMNEQKRVAIRGLRPLAENRAMRSPSWWAWTVWLAYAITIDRIENA